MNPSPFHGIFSAFQEEHREDASPASVAAVSGQSAAVSNTTGAVGAKGQIAVDIYEQDGYYIIRAPIAGVRLSDLDIEVDDKVLTIRGNRALSDTVAQDQYYVQECFWGEFARSVTLPCVIDPKRVKATFSKDGILKVLIPKEEKVKIVRINEG
jgi:HSP20 family molecular chaperone IbpA